MKQVILVRMDLKIPKGKLVVQCAHASVAAALASAKKNVDAWVQEGMMKAVLKVKNLDDLLHYQQQAEKASLTCVLITDAGKTVFKEATVTCLGIGPADEKKIDQITGKLKLL